MYSDFLKLLLCRLFCNRLFEKISLKNYCFLLEVLARAFLLHFPENSIFKELNTLLYIKASRSVFPPLAFTLLLTLRLLVLPQEDLLLLLQIGFVKGIFIDEGELVCFRLRRCHEAKIDGPS